MEWEVTELSRSLEAPGYVQGNDSRDDATTQR